LILFDREPARAPEGVSDGADYDFTAAFEANLNGSSTAPEEEREEHPAETDASSSEQGSASPAAAEASTSQDDDPDVELPFDGSPKTFKLKALQGIIEEHASYAPRFAEAAQAASAATAQRERLEAAYGEMLNRAQARYAPYKDIDWMVLSRDTSIDPETFRQVREDAQAAHNDLAFLTNEIDGRLSDTQKAVDTARQSAVQAAAVELHDPEKGIKDFQSVYPKLVAFGKQHGVPDIENVYEPALIRLLHKAYLYDTGAKTVDSQVQKVINKPTRVIKPGPAASADSSAKDGINKALKNLRTNPNDSDAITQAFLASF